MSPERKHQNKAVAIGILYTFIARLNDAYQK